MLDQAEHEAREKATALRAAEFAPLTSRAVTEQARRFVDALYSLVIAEEARLSARARKRGDAAALAFRNALGAFVGDLLSAAASEKTGADGWAHRSVSPGSFTDGPVSYRHFTALREPLRELGLVEEASGVNQWTAFGVGNRWSTRFRATPKLIALAEEHGLRAGDAHKHFVLGLPEHPLVCKRISGVAMKIAYNDKLCAMEQRIKDLNGFMEGFDIGGGAHRGYIRVFHQGDHPTFRWNLGGRLYSQGGHSYQQLSGGERLKMTINAQPVCELDVKSSALTIFHAVYGQPLDFTCNPDPYALRELSDTPREVVKRFITVTFGQGQFPTRWPQNFAREYEATNGQRLSTVHPISRVRDAVARAYPLLAALRRDDGRPPIWAKLEYLESEAVLGAMVALQAAGISSLSVYDSLIVQVDNEQMARDILTEMYRSTTGAAPHIVTRYPSLTALNC